jgi:hypothetical protein
LIIPSLIYINIKNPGHGLALAHAVGHHLGAAAQAVLVAPAVVANIASGKNLQSYGCYIELHSFM